jgi:dihydrofolate synthase / folylpolyglutamate synthase
MVSEGFEARPEDVGSEEDGDGGDGGDTLKRSVTDAHYHFLLEFCHTHPGSHEPKPPHWRQEIELSWTPSGVGHDVPDWFLGFLSSREGFGIKKGLENVRALFDRLGVLEGHPPVVLVGGTNGKGTVASAVADALSTVGYRPGLYMSPHVERFLERIQVMGGDPDDEVLEASCKRVMQVVRELDEEGLQATYFEVATALAVEVFRRHGADVWVLEVGMGGRLDAVNALDPAVSLITTVGTDHEEHLGAELAQRAREKAGIMRPGVPCFTAAHGVALETLREVAMDQDVPLVQVTGDPGLVHWDSLRSLVRSALSDPRVQQVLPRLEKWTPSSLVLPRLPGRQEMWRFPGGAQVLLDVGHNAEALGALGSRLQAMDSGTGRVLMVGLLGDKDPAPVAQLAAGFERVVTVTPPSPRAFSADQLREALVEAGVEAERVEAFDAPLAGLQAALRATPGDGLLVITGSFYVAGVVRPALREVAHRA